MDPFSDDSGDAAPNATVLLDTVILKVEYVTQKYCWLCPMISDAYPNLLPSLQNCKWSIERAMARYRGIPVKGDGASSGDAEEEPLDLETVVNASGVEDSEIVFNPACEMRFKSLLSTTGVIARCLVECTVLRRGRQHAKERVKAYVTGEWPVIADVVRYEIHALPKTYGGQTTLPGARVEYDATPRGCGIAPSPMGHATVADFYNLLVRTCRMQERAANTIVQSLFPSVYEMPLKNLEQNVHRTLTGPVGLAIDYRNPLANTFDVAELRDVIDKSTAIGWVNIDHPRVLFPVIGAFFYPIELARVCAAYRTKNRWLDVLVRGGALIKHVAFLLDRAPHVLNVKRLKFLDCLHKQNEVKAQKKRLGSSVSRMALVRLDTECASLRGMLLLPERSFSQYVETMMTNRANGLINVLPDAELTVATTALDIYSLLQRDQASMDTLYADDSHKARCELTEHGKTSGNMFTVIDDTPRTSVGGDASSTLGLVSIDAWQPLPSVAPTTMAVDGPTINDDSDTLDVPLLPRVTSAPVVADRSFQAARCLNDIVSCLVMPCTSDDFVAGMRWLIAKNIVTKVPMLGTAPHNANKPFDAFYLSSVYALQAKCVGAISDIYRRGLQAAIRRHERTQSPSYDIALERQRYARQVDRLREKVAFFAAARQNYRALCYWHSAFLKTSKKAPDIDEAMLETDGNKPPTRADTEAAILAAAKELCSHVKAFVSSTENDDDDNDDPLPDPSDPYADLMPTPHPGERSLVFPLLRNPDPVNFDGEFELCAEQKRAVLRGNEAPIVIIDGRAGTGKTACLQKILESYPPEQICIASIVGKVVSELLRRVGSARTIHSLLFSHVLHQQAMQRAESILASLKASVRSTGQENSALGQIVAFRADLHRILGTFDSPSPFENVRVLVIDEGSLVPFPIFESLLSAIHVYQQRSGRFIEKIVICGDPNQLNSIDYGSVMSDMIHAFPWCVHHMTINHRSEGTAIFNFANDVVMRRLGKPGHPFPRFDGDANWLKLTVPVKYNADGLNDEQLIEARRQADDASIVFLSANRQTLPSTIERALDLLGALTMPAKPETIEIRKSILMIASTRYVVGRLNSIVRTLFLRETLTKLGETIETSPETGEALLPPAYANRIVPGETIMLTRNWHETFQVAVSDDDDNAAAQSERVVALNEAALAVKLTLAKPMRRVVNSFYNGELLEVVGFYDAPVGSRTKAWCRCDLCPPPSEDQVGQSSCMLAPHEVPMGRRAPVDMDSHLTIKYHTQGMRFEQGALLQQDVDKRRKAVFRVVNEPDRFKEVDVADRLGGLSQFKFVKAATVHVFQGSEADTIFFVIPSDNSHFDVTSVYTAITRGRRRLVVVGDREAFMNTVNRQPALRRSDMWALMAIEANATHRALHSDGDPLRLAHVLKLDDDITRAFVDTRRNFSGKTRAELWKDYETVKHAALAHEE